jgi:hypothetical protein
MKGDCEFSVGQAVRVNDGVRPRGFSGKLGKIIEIRGDEVGVRFGGQSSHICSTWFRRSEVASTDVGQRPPDPLCGLETPFTVNSPAMSVGGPQTKHSGTPSDQVEGPR